MALFSTYRQPQSMPGNHRPAGPPQQRVVVINEQEALRKLRTVRCLCHERQAHALPVEMIQLEEKPGKYGAPLLVMACPYRNCSYQEGWVIDFHTGQPRRLFRKQADGR